MDDALLNGGQLPHRVDRVRQPLEEHPAFFCSSRLTLNVTRKAMADMGYCPSGRLFEAAACGVPVLSDTWEGFDTFFEPGAEVLIVAHLGDGNIHYIVQYAWERWRALADPQAVRADIAARIHDLAMAHRGTFSAEHGIGQKLRGELARYRSPVELRMMRAVKDALDPRGLMNPGKLLPD